MGINITNKKAFITKTVKKYNTLMNLQRYDFELIFSNERVGDQAGMEIMIDNKYLCVQMWFNNVYGYTNKRIEQDIKHEMVHIIVEELYVKGNANMRPSEKEDYLIVLENAVEHISRIIKTK